MTKIISKLEWTTLEDNLKIGIHYVLCFHLCGRVNALYQNQGMIGDNQNGRAKYMIYIVVIMNAASYNKMVNCSLCCA